jgi:putative CocE/NonD family hydrolase
VKPLPGPLAPAGKPDFRVPLSTPPNELSREALAFLWDSYRHPEYDSYWAQIDGLQHISKVRVPALVAGGWYDIFTKGSIDSYIAMKKSAGTTAARRGTMLVMDCCGHSMGLTQPATVSWGNNKTVYNSYRDRFMDHYLKGIDNGIDREPPVQLSVLVPPDAGTQGDTFVFKAADFPVPGTRYLKYFLGSGGKANTRDGDGVLAMEHAAGGAADSYSYDPANPVPSRGGTHGNTMGAMDQADVVKRPDVLVYTATPAAHAQAIIGKVSAHFWAATDGKDTDFVALLVDVHPDGHSHVIVERIVRGRFRKGRNLPAELLKPNVPYPYDLDLGYTATLLRPGHRLQLLISSSSYPGYERNLNTGASNEDTAETRIARNTVLHDAAHPSYVQIPVVEGVSPP